MVRSLRKMILFILGLLIISACVQKTVNSPKKSEPWRVEIKAGKDEGTVDKEFFKTIVDQLLDNKQVTTPKKFEYSHIKEAINISVKEIYKDCNLVVF